jgi:hypothetical protein
VASLRPALAALGASAAASLECRLTHGDATMAATAATVLGDSSGGGASRVRCAFGSDAAGAAPLPAGEHALELWLAGAQVALAEGEVARVTVSGPRVAMVSSHEVVTTNATYTAIALELTGTPSQPHRVPWLC